VVAKEVVNVKHMVVAKEVGNENLMAAEKEVGNEKAMAVEREVVNVRHMVEIEHLEIAKQMVALSVNLLMDHRKVEKDADVLQKIKQTVLQGLNSFSA
jgi:hypothetical protein